MKTMAVNIIDFGKASQTHITGVPLFPSSSLISSLLLPPLFPYIYFHYYIFLPILTPLIPLTPLISHRI